jgi:3-methyladenine DNA glycosylase AlkC
VAGFKDEMSPDRVRALGVELKRAWPSFAEESFAAEACDGLESLELMARLRQVAAVLARHLPGDFAAAVGVLDAALASPTFTSWITLPCGLCVAEAGIDEPEIALPLLARLSPRCSSEWAVRPFIERDPDIAMKHILTWAGDADEHVRRLASETTRPRLPWASRLAQFVRDPSPVVALLELLRDDPSEYVRRSVANNLNDISKDHPDVALGVARRWLESGSTHADDVVRRGLRSLVKGGDPEALALLGFDAGAPVRLESLTVSPRRVPVGGAVTMELTLRADGERVPVVVDYLVHHAGARGPRDAKVFKLTTRILRPGEPVTIRRRHVFREVTVRRLYPGLHRVEVQVNGRVLGAAEVELVASLEGAS